jgi:hypothetical protein
MTSTKKFLLAVAGTGALLLGACGSDNNQLDDAPVGEIDDSPQFVMTNLDGFPNIGFRCFSGPDVEGTLPTGIYTTTRDNDNFKIVVNDPQCPGYDAGFPTVVSK